MTDRPLSMTSFGRGLAGEPPRTWTVEIRSVNHRYCEINVRLPRSLSALEDRVRRAVAGAFGRGRIDVTIDQGGGPQAAVRLSLNTDLARQYHDCLRELATSLGLPFSADLALVAAYPDVIAATPVSDDPEGAWPLVAAALEQALAAAHAMRAAEGRHLQADLLARLDTFAATVQGIEAQAPELAARRRQATEERLQQLLGTSGLDPVRLAQECAILTDRTDVTEELVRLTSHLGQFRSFLAQDEPVGRRLDFLAQEILRELNTLGAKINEAGTSHAIVELKNELERIREQVQNIE
ncbi:MAG: YicC/YloC family endoribonuclease [Thermodesulfobacteriota bacterium]